MTVRSKQLYGGPIGLSPGLFSQLYACPVGFRTIIRSVKVINFGPANNTATLNLTDSSSAITYFQWFGNKLFAPQDRFNDEVWSVMHQTQQIRGFVPIGSLSIPLCLISGAELAL